MTDDDIAVRSPDIGSLVVAFFLASFAFSAFKGRFVFLGLVTREHIDSAAR